MRIIGIVLAFISFLLLVLGHEFGHFSVGKLLGFKINEFSVGMGPQLWGKTKGETEYSLRAIPIGGYCAFEGENSDEEDDNGVRKEPDPRSFNLQPAWKKILVLVAGSFNNIVIGLIIFAIVFTITGSLTTKLSGVVEGKPAAQAGIMEGDRVLSVNGTEYSEWAEVTEAIANAEGDDIVLTVDRDGQILSFTVHTYKNEEGRKVVGIMAGREHSLGTAIKTAFSECTTMIRALRDFFVRLFRGQASSDDVGSIVQIIAVSGEYAENYGLMTVIYLIALVSVNLGFMNMLPIPGLDGGRILFVIIRWITRGKLTDKVENIINNVFMFALIALMVVLMFKDVIHLIK
ncbi:MAG: site-2 protease family protein [Firmicutes bacterium]|nr:site-2 protease family protein [Bacillota bacterium]